MTAVSPATPRTPKPPGGTFAYLPGLDGLRAVSVIAVLLYHAELGVVSGGFLGVEVFFVISGYLITSLLLAERDREGGVSVAQFWRRRARRLLPALYAMLVAVVVAAATIAPDVWPRMRGDVFAALGYYSNWWQIFHQDSYFVAVGRPSPLAHLWSLAVEEQFYILWPLVFAFWASRFSKQRMAAGAIAAGLASAVWMAVLYDPTGDPSRVYFGTDTRLSGLLLGVGFAALWPAGGFRRERAAPRAGAVLDTVGVTGLVVLLWAFLRVNEFDPFVYRGGFVLVDVATLAVIAVTVHPAARLGRVMGVGVLTWIGRRSYGLYLWHWPVYVLTRPDLDVPVHGWALLALRLAVTFALAEASYRWVEMPIRRGALTGSLGQIRRPATSRARPAALRIVGSPLVVLVLAGALLVVGPLRTDDTADALATSTVLEIDDAATTTTAPTTTVAPTTTTVAPQVAPAAPSPTPPPTTAPPPPPTTTAPPTPIPGGVTALGDSVMIAAADEMRTTLPGVNISARVSRQFDEAIVALAGLREQGRLQGNLVVHLGTNGWFTPGQLDQFMSYARDRRVVFLTARAPRTWVPVVNQRLREGVERWDNASLVDWEAYGNAHLDLFLDDGIHLNPAGQQAYADFVRDALR